MAGEEGIDRHQRVGVRCLDVPLFAPAETRSRMLGVLPVYIGFGPIGFTNIGLLADCLGAPKAIVVAGIEGLVAMALAFPLWRRIR